MEKKFAIGADIGGSHISTVLIDMEKGSVLIDSLAEQKVDNQASADEILMNWAKAIQKTMDHAKDGELAGIGFAMPGPFDYKTGVALLKNVAKYESLYGINVGDKLKRILNLPASMPFRYLNDALSFAIGESWLGKASAYKNVVAITLGTGFGSAFLTYGVPVIEGARVPKMGYVYHIPYEAGIADDYFSTRWFVGEYAVRTGIVCRGVKEIAERAGQELDAKSLFDDFGTNLANFLAPLLQTFGANCLVLGGNISGAFPLFGKSFGNTIQNHRINIEIVISELNELAAMAGSARLLDEEFWKEVEPTVSKI
jgi:glucokinase